MYALSEYLLIPEAVKRLAFVLPAVRFVLNLARLGNFLLHICRLVSLTFICVFLEERLKHAWVNAERVKCDLSFLSLSPGGVFCRITEITDLLF